MGRFLVRVSTIAVLATGAVSAFALVSSAPAFNGDLRRDNVFEQDILQRGSDMYDRSRYLMQQAVSYIRADLIPFGGSGDGQIVASVDVVMERGADAVALMEESLALNPGNAHGWAVMAWAQLYAGNDAEAAQALQTSWALAPYNFALAPERIDLALALFSFVFEDLDIEDPDLVDTEVVTDEAPALDAPSVDLPDEVRMAILRDLETVKLKHRRESYDFFVAELRAADLGLDLPPPES